MSYSKYFVNVRERLCFGLKQLLFKCYATFVVMVKKINMWLWLWNSHGHVFCVKAIHPCCFIRMSTYFILCSTNICNFLVVISFDLASHHFFFFVHIKSGTENRVISVFFPVLSGKLLQLTKVLHIAGFNIKYKTSNTHKHINRRYTK